MAKIDTRRLDMGQLELMWNFLRMGYQQPNIEALKENCDRLRQAMIQKTAGQRKGDPEHYIDLFNDTGTIINCIVIETMALYLSGALDRLECEENG